MQLDRRAPQRWHPSPSITLGDAFFMNEGTEMYHTINGVRLPAPIGLEWWARLFWL